MSKDIKTTHADSENRIIYICGEINNSNLSEIIFQLINWIELDNLSAETIKEYSRIPIKIFLETYGGDVGLANNLINIILNSKTPVYTYALGDCFSAGFLIFLSGHKRYVGKYGCLMYHQILSSTYHTCEHIKNFSEKLQNEQDMIEEYITEQTKIPISKLKEIRKCQKDWYMGSTEAMEFGIATEIYKGI